MTTICIDNDTRPATDDTDARRPAPVSTTKKLPKKTSKKTTGRAAPHDPWADWAPVFRIDRAAKKPAPATPHMQQEKIAPSKNVVLRDHRGDKKQTAARRRIVDARLWDGMTPAEQDAAIHIATAYETMGRGMGYVSSDWQRIRGSGFGGNPSEAHARLLRQYIHWAEACAKEKISHAMIIDILVFGISCRAQDRDRRCRAGTARQNLADGLQLYCKIMGWK